jgi:hypothetical protein
MFKRKCKHDWYYINSGIQGAAIIRTLQLLVVKDIPSNVESLLTAANLYYPYFDTNAYYFDRICVKCGYRDNSIADFVEKCIYVATQELIKEHNAYVLLHKEGCNDITDYYESYMKKGASRIVSMLKSINKICDIKI